MACRRLKVTTTYPCWDHIPPARCRQDRVWGVLVCDLFVVRRGAYLVPLPVTRFDADNTLHPSLPAGVKLAQPLLRDAEPSFFPSPLFLPLYVPYLPGRARSPRTSLTFR